MINIPEIGKTIICKIRENLSVSFDVSIIFMVLVSKNSVPIHRYINTHTHIYSHTHIHTDAQTYTHTYIYTQTRTHSHSQSHSLTHPHIHTDADAQTYTHTYMYKQIHTYCCVINDYVIIMFCSLLINHVL